MSLNLVVGYCGRLTLAHAGYFAVGAYSYALLTRLAGWEFLPAVFTGAVIAAVLSLLLSLPSLKLKGDFFILISITVQVLIYSVISNWMSPDYSLGTWENLTNGTYGISGITKPVIFGYKLDTRISIAILSLSCAGVCAFVVWRLVSSPWGRLLKVIRDDELVARGLGKNVRLAKVQAFAFSCGIASVAGALYASYVQFIDHHAASLDESILLLSMVIVGGVGNFRGPIVGALVILITPELLRFLLTHAPIPFVENPEQYIPNLRLVIYGVLLVVLVHLRPQGVAGEYRFE